MEQQLPDPRNGAQVGDQTCTNRGQKREGDGPTTGPNNEPDPNEFSNQFAQRRKRQRFENREKRERESIEAEARQTVWANSRQMKRKYEDPGFETQDANLDGANQIRVECRNIDPVRLSRAYVNVPLQ